VNPHTRARIVRVTNGSFSVFAGGVMGTLEVRGRHVGQTADVRGGGARCGADSWCAARTVGHRQTRPAPSDRGCGDSWGGGVVGKAPVAASTMVSLPAGWRSKTSAHYRWSFVRSPICSSVPLCSTPWSPRRRYAGNKRWTVSTTSYSRFTFPSYGISKRITFPRIVRTLPYTHPAGCRAPTTHGNECLTNLDDYISVAECISGNHSSCSKISSCRFIVSDHHGSFCRRQFP